MSEREENDDPQKGRAESDAMRNAILRGRLVKADDEEQLIGRYSEMEACYQSWLRGQKHPDDHYYAAIWNGETKGADRTQVERRLEKQRGYLDHVTSGKPIDRPRSLLAYGATREQIVTALQKSIEENERALECEGRNLSINQARVLALKKESRG